MAELFRVKISQFLDSRKIADKVEREKWSAFTRIGGTTRKIIRSLIRRPGKRKAGQSSEPGKPPYNQTELYRDSMAYGVDRASESVVIGPRADVNGTRQRPKAPEALEYGGYVVRSEIVGGARDAQGRFTKGFQERETTRKYYRARPHVRPAGEKAQRTYPELFKDLLSKGGGLIGGR